MAERNLLRLPGWQEPADILSSEFLSRKEILRALILQIKKDFASAGMPIKLLLGTTYTFESLRETLVHRFHNETATALFNLLYRIDVSEKQLREGMPTPGIDLALLAEVIIKRELQKVVLRMMYSSQTADDASDDTY